MARILLAPFLRWAGKLRHPTLFWVTGGLFLLDMLVPDMIPLADEILLGLATMLFANWKNRRDVVVPPPHR